MSEHTIELVDPDDIDPVRETPFDYVSTAELRRNAWLILASLKPRERDIVERHLGLFDDNDSTHVAIAKSLGVTTPRVWQLFCKGMRKLRHPARSKYLRGFITP